MLNVSGLGVSYGNIQAIRNVNLSVLDNEVVVVIGANGAGKTTLIRAITGLVPRSGEINFMGKRIETLPPHAVVKMGISCSPDGRQVFPAMSVAENLDMGAYSLDSWSSRKADMEQVYNLFPVLRQRESQLAGTLSGGEQQMLAVGRALMARPKLLLLDEPSMGLAPKMARLIFEKVREIRAMGTAVLLIEQNARLALMVADRGYVLETGEVKLSGTSRELLESDLVKQAYLGHGT